MGLRPLAGALGVLCALSLAVAPAVQAVPPALTAPWASDVFATTARLHGTVDPNGIATTYRFELISEAAYEANVKAGKDGFLGFIRAPKVEGSVGSGDDPVAVVATASGLSTETTYLYRLRALGSGVFFTEPERLLTRPEGGGDLLADGRAWEMVSPVDKNGGQVAAPGAIMGGGALQAAAQGSAATYGSATSFAGGSGAPPASQYLATRTATGWTTRNISAPLFAGSYGTEPEGVPYRLFSSDLARGLLLSGQHCRGEASGCPVANPPLPGTGAPAGYQNYYLRESASAAFTSLLTAADIGTNPLDPASFELTLAGASADLRHVVLSSCAALTSDAVEVVLGAGCDPEEQNLYAWSAENGLELINLLPGDFQGTPGAELAAPATAISADGSRTYFTQGGDLYLREGGETFQVDQDAGGGGSFQTATPDGSISYFTKAEHLWRYGATSDSAIDLTPGGDVKGVLGVSPAGNYLYYAKSSGLFLHSEGQESFIAGPIDPANYYPPATGTAHLSADGTKLAFTATAPLTEYDNLDANTGTPDAQVYLYDAERGELSCASCNPTNGRPIGPSSLPGATANGEGPAKTQAYKPRALSADGQRVFFDSRDALVGSDTNNDWDAYEWEAKGKGSCTTAAGCISLISSGRAEGGASFIDASADGSDAFFITDGSLVKADPGSVDLYDARIGGGFPEAEEDIVCQGNACQGLLSEPSDPALNTERPGLGNPRERYLGEGRPCKKGKVRRGGKCVPKHRKKRGPRQGKGKKR